jgi:hypothetical protein
MIFKFFTFMYDIFINRYLLFKSTCAPVCCTSTLPYNHIAYCSNCLPYNLPAVQLVCCTNSRTIILPAAPINLPYELLFCRTTSSLPYQHLSCRTCFFSAAPVAVCRTNSNLPHQKYPVQSSFMPYHQPAVSTSFLPHH